MKSDIALKVIFCIKEKKRIVKATINTLGLKVLWQKRLLDKPIRIFKQVNRSMS